MLLKRYRLQIQSVISRSSRNVRAGGITLKVFPNDLPYGRFGVIIPKAVAKTAVLRNRLKRAAFDAFVSQQKNLIGRDTLCIVSRGAPLTRDGMMREITRLLANV
ncbi:MAG: ribonuclease P protein component [bacterium]|nr:ribonuclease P protein component [bacterium]